MIDWLDYWRALSQSAALTYGAAEQTSEYAFVSCRYIPNSTIDSVLNFAPSGSC